jgi:hypothetical protein
MVEPIDTDERAEALPPTRTSPAIDVRVLTRTNERTEIPDPPSTVERRETWLCTLTKLLTEMVEPLCAAAKTLVAVQLPMNTAPRTVKSTPMRANPRTETALPKLAELNTLALSPQRANDLTLTALPNCVASNTLRAPFAFTASKTVTVPATLAKLLTEIILPAVRYV